MSERSAQRRSDIAAAIIRFRQFIFEAAGGCFAFAVAWRAVDTWEGKPAAPFTMSAVLEVNNGVWFWALLLTGVLKWVGVAVGYRTNNGFRLRGVVGFIAGFVWTCVFVASKTVPGPASVSAGYGALAVFSFIEGLCLMLDADAFHLGQKATGQKANSTRGQKEGACGHSVTTRNRQRVL